MSLNDLARCILRDLLSRPKFITDLHVNLDERLKLAMDWLCLAQDSQTDGGVSLKYSLIKGWSASYPETTGYIIPTFHRYSQLANNTNYLARAKRMADWLLSIQQNDGSFKREAVDSESGSLVFDTGQILFGLVAAHKITGEDAYLEQARKAGIWLVDVQDDDGAWRKSAYHSIPHTYYTRVAWGLAELGEATKDDIFSKTACKNIDWALTKQLKNGWFDCAGFIETTHKAPYTHTIAYIIRGILESGICLKRDEYIDAAKRSADALLDIINRDSYCWGTYDSNWMPSARYSCLTGNAQIAIIFLKFYELTKNDAFFETAIRLNSFLCQTQNVKSSTPLPIRGGIAGSFPVWRRYMKFSYPNWAIKFFVDSLMMEKKIRKS